MTDEFIKESIKNPKLWSKYVDKKNKDIKQLKKQKDLIDKVIAGEEAELTLPLLKYPKLLNAYDKYLKNTAD